MAYNRLPSNTPDLLRKHGLKVVEVDGWQTRGRPASTGEFTPVGVLCHHTATGTNWTDQKVVNLLVNGRDDLPGPLVQFGLSRDGTVYVVASGRCNHAGEAKASGTVASGDGNKLYIGIEAFNDGINEIYPQVQYDTYVLLCAVLSVELTKNSVNTIRGHKETSTTGKPDPRFDMTKFRAAVQAKMTEITNPVIPPVVDPPIEPTEPPVDPEPEVVYDGFGLYKWYSGKPSGTLVIEPGSWKRLGLKEPASKITAESSEHRLLYLRLELPSGRTADRVVETKFVRANGDATAYDSEEFGLKKDSHPYYNMHFEDGDGAGGEWWIKVTGGTDPIKVTTRYAKQHTYYEKKQ